MQELLCGKNTVLDALKNALPIQVIYTSRPEFFKNAKVKIKIMSNHELNRMTSQNHQGFIALLSEFNYYNLETIIQDRAQKVLMLDHVQDPRNLGAIMRSANAFGVVHIIIPKKRATKVTTSTLKVASGGHVNMKIIRVNSLSDAISKLKKHQFWIYATSLKEDALMIQKAHFNHPMVIILGNEEKGISQTLLKQADQKIYLPMKGTVQSLNVAVSAGIVLFSLM